MLSEYNCDILLYWVPSGNFWHSYWKLIYPLKMMIFHSYVNVYQRVYRVILPILLISWGLSPRYALRHVDWLGIVISSQLRETTYLAQWNHQGSFTYLRAVGVKHQVFDITKVVWRFGRHSRTCGGRGLDVFPFSNRPMCKNRELTLNDRPFRTSQAIISENPSISTISTNKIDTLW